MSSEECVEEIEVLSAIYGLDLEHRKSAWNLPSFLLRIRPTALSDGSCFVSLDLVFTLPKLYPKVPPNYDFDAVKGLSDKCLEELKQKLHEEAISRSGQVMCYELATVAKDYLEIYNKRPQSLFESMTSRHQREGDVLRRLRSDSNSYQETRRDYDATGQKKDLGGKLTGEDLNGEKGEESHVILSPDHLLKEQKARLEAFKQSQKDSKYITKPSAAVAGIASIGRFNRRETVTVDTANPNPNKLMIETETVEGQGLETAHVPTQQVLERSSRYHDEFEEICLLGKGASGEVWKVRNKLDRRFYAVKKIAMGTREKESGLDRKIRREVTTVSRLLHKHIVRYFAAWVEEKEVSGGAIVKESPVARLDSQADNSSSSSSTSSSDDEDEDSNDDVSASKSSESSSSSSSSSSVSAIQHAGSNLRTYSKFYHTSTATLDSDTESCVDDRRNRFIGGVHSCSEDFGFEYSDTGTPREGLDLKEGGDNEMSNSGTYGESRDQTDYSPMVGGLKGKLSMSIKKPSMKQRHLFIQMEYCKTTLRAVIDECDLSLKAAEIHLLLRQMLEALAYIHSRGMIHRDLKPANIFLDAEGNIKIGDFGLARLLSAGVGAGEPEDDIQVGSYGFDGECDEEPNRYSSHQSLSQSGVSLSGVGAADSSHTGGVGTAMYSAPEQQEGKSGMSKISKFQMVIARQYNERADMFSMGVILFEMCRPPFSTGMERVLTLRALRDTGTLPPDFPAEGAFVGFRQIITWLVQHQPTQRPSAAELLLSPLLPPRIDTDSMYLREITEALWRPNSEAAAGIISALFRCSQRSRRSLPSLSTAQPGGGERDVDFSNLWPYDHNELALSHGQLKPRVISRTKALTPSFESPDTHRSGGREKVKKDPFSTLSAAVSSTTAQDLFLSLTRHLRSVLEVHGAVEFVPATLLQLRDSPAVTMAADILFARSLLLARTAPPVSKGKRNMYDLWTQNVPVPGSTGTAVAEYLEPGAGLIVSLPFDLISPFARTASLLSIQASVRYQIGRVYSSRSTCTDADTMPNRDQGGAEQTPMTPLGAGVGEHPLGANEAVFDVVRCGAGTSRVDVECQVLSAALSCLCVFRPNLPMLAVRVTDSRLLDALLEVCLWPRPPSLSPSAPTPTPTLHAAEGPHVDIEKLLRALSLCSDVEEGPGFPGSPLEEGRAPKYMQLLAELNLPQWLAKRLVPFFRIFSSQLQPTQYLENTQFVGCPLSVLDALEIEFYSQDVIVALQRLLAKQGDRPGPTPEGEWVGHKLSQSQTESDVISSSQISVVKESKAKMKHHGGHTHTQSELSSVLSSIGVKAAGPGSAPRDKDKERVHNGQKDRDHRVKGGEGPAGGRGVLRDRATGAGAGAGADLSSTHHQEAFSRDDLQRLRFVISSFDLALGQLRSTFVQLIESLPASTDPDLSMSRHPYRLVVDLGSDPRRRALNPFAPQAFSSLGGEKGRASRAASPMSIGGLYFEIEAFYDALHSMSSSSASVAVGSSSGGKPFLSPVPVTPTPTRNDLHHTPHTPHPTPNRRRHKGALGVLIDGGHFEHLMHACRSHNRGAGDDLIAMGMRIKIDSIVSFLLKTEEKKLEADVRSRKASKRNSRSVEKDRVTEGAGMHIMAGTGEGRLAAFLTKWSSSSPDVVVMLSKPLPFSEGHAARPVSAYSATPLIKRTEKDLGLVVDTRDSVQLTSFSPLLHPHTAHLHTSSALLAVTTCRLRCAGLRAVDAQSFLADTTRAPSPVTLGHSDLCRSEIDVLVEQCYHSKVPFLVLLSNQEGPVSASDVTPHTGASPLKSPSNGSVQIWTVAEVCRDMNSTAARVGSIGLTTNISSGCGVGGIGGSTPNLQGVELCALKDLPTRLTRSMLRERARRAEEEVESYERTHSSSSSVVPLPPRHSHDTSHSHSSTFSSLSDKIENAGSALSEGRASTNPGAGSPHKSRYNQGNRAPIRHVTLVMLDAPSFLASDKERDRPASGGKAIATHAAKEKVQIEKRVAAFAAGMWGVASLHVIQSQRMRAHHSGGQGQGQGVVEGVVVIACELSFQLLRDLGSTIMRVSSTPSHPMPQSHSIVPPGSLMSSFYSTPLAAPHKRFLKAVVAELSYVSAPPLLPAKSSSSSATPAAGATAGSASQSLSTPLRDAFLYSIVDDKFDFISYSPAALARVT